MALLTIESPPQTSDVKTLSGYLYRLVEQLKNTLTNIDVSNMTEPLRKALASYTTAAEIATKIETLLSNNGLALSGNVKQDYETLRDTIFSTADDVTAVFESLISQTDSEIRAYVEANYMASADGITLEETLTSLISQTAQLIRFEFTTLAIANADAIESLNVLYATYFNFTDEYLEIGQTGASASDLVTRIRPGKTEFAVRDTDAIIAYIDAVTNKMHIAEGSFEDLVAGDPDAQRVEIGVNESNEPHITFYNNAGVEGMQIKKNVQSYGNGVRTATWTNGDEVGLADFIEV